MKYSIKFKLTMTLTISIAITIFICWFINKTYLPKYYEYNKMNDLAKTYDEVNGIFNKLDITSEEDIEHISIILDRLSSNKGTSVYVFNLFYLGNKSYMPIYVYPELDSQQSEMIANRLQDYYFGSNISENSKEILKKTEDYSIFKVFDKRIDSYYMEFLGMMDSGYRIYIRSNFQSIKEGVGIANQFLMYVGIVVIIIGSIMMLIISSNFTKPLHELSNIAKNISEQNFEIKYTHGRKDEIGKLGTSINQIAEKLEDTISELKSANNELHKDIENKTQIDEMRKEFLSNVTHELKTPIALIQGYAEGLNDNIIEDQESREFYLGVIIDEAQKMNAMVSKLLSLNKLESGNDKIAFERFDITMLLKNVMESTKILFEQKGVTCKTNINEPIYVWADEFMVEEVITNYISNALNHVSGENIISIDVWVRGKTVRITVFNTGDLIPEEDLAHLWTKFYKVDKARTREYGGSGIGLSIVKAIMESLQQEYGVRNEINGVTFWFDLDISS